MEDIRIIEDDELKTLSKNLYNLPRPLGFEPPLIPFWFSI
jgi:hypothetical protein